MAAVRIVLTGLLTGIMVGIPFALIAFADPHGMDLS